MTKTARRHHSRPVILTIHNSTSNTQVMKKGIQIVLALVIGLPFQSLAKAGLATDGLQFILALAGILLLVAALLKGTDYLFRNGRRIFIRAGYLIKRIAFSIRSWWQDLAAQGSFE